MTDPTTPAPPQPAAQTPPPAPTSAGPTSAGPLARVVARVMGLFPVRVFLFYASAQGPLLASGLAYQAIFAVFAALWVGFSIAGLIVAGNAALQQPIIALLASAIPGLIKATPTSNGAIDPTTLLNAGVIGWTGAIALVGVLVTAIGWLASARAAVRIIFGLPQETTPFALQKLRDLAIALGFALVLVISAALSVAGSAATGALLGLIGISPTSVPGNILGRVVTLAVMFALDAATLGALYRVLSGVHLTTRRMRGGVLIGAAALGILKVAGGTLLGVSKSNPLLASFAVILGLLIFFNVVCQVILLAASWIAVGMHDRGLTIAPVLSRRERARIPRAS